VLRSLEDARRGGRSCSGCAGGELYRGPHLSDFLDLLVGGSTAPPIRAVRAPGIGTIAGDFPWNGAGGPSSQWAARRLGPTFRLG